MKTRIVRIVIATTVMTLLLMVVEVQAQDKKVDQTLRSELKAYALTNVKPVMKLKREMLENELTTLEKKQIEGLRIQLGAIHKARMASNRTLRERMDGNELDESQKEVTASERKQIRKIMLEAFSIADKHEKTMDQISLDTRMDREKWRKELREITEKFKGRSAGDFFTRLERIGAGESVRPALFLLWDPEKQY